MMNFDKEALLQQLKTPQDETPTGAMGNLAAGMGGIGAALGGGARGAGGPTSNTMPIRERAPINDQVEAAPSPMPPPPGPPPPVTPMAPPMAPPMLGGSTAPSNIQAPSGPMANLIANMKRQQPTQPRRGFSVNPLHLFR